MTINDLPERLRVEGVQIFEPGKVVVVKLTEENYLAHEKNLRRLLDKQESA